MFGRRKVRPWYWRVVAILAALRVIYGFARFFMKIVDKQAALSEKQLRRRIGKTHRWW